MSVWYFYNGGAVLLQILEDGIVAICLNEKVLSYLQKGRIVLIQTNNLFTHLQEI